jgi:hypothetical protein
MKTTSYIAAICLTAITPLSARAREAVDVELQLTRARVALDRARGSLSAGEFSDLDRQLSRAEEEWRGAKSLAIERGLASPNLMTTVAPAVAIAAPAAAAAAVEALTVLAGLTTVIYVLNQYKTTDESLQRELNKLRATLQGVVATATVILAKMACTCTCLGNATSKPDPDTSHGDRNVGKVPFAAECRAECFIRGFTSYQCV